MLGRGLYGDAEVGQEFQGGDKFGLNVRYDGFYNLDDERHRDLRFFIRSGLARDVRVRFRDLDFVLVLFGIEISRFRCVRNRCRWGFI